MKTIISLIAFFALSIISTAQKYCGFDSYKDHLCTEVHYQNLVDDQDLTLHDRIIAGNLYGGGQIFTIPTVVHIIHDGGSENLSDETVENAIEWLNDAYANEGFYGDEEGKNVPIRFCLAHVDPEGENHPGVHHVQSSLTTVTIPIQDQELKDLIRWDTEKYLNIWVVASLIRELDNEAIVGNSTLPASHGLNNDGIIIEAAFFGGSENQNKVLIHEVGHYLGLYHTFQGGCGNNDCLTDGDQVCDTPPDGLGSGVCDDVNSCSTDEDDESDNNPFRPVALGGLGDQNDKTENYMDYSYLPCYRTFTDGQSNRMVAALLEIRATLLDGDRCNTPCEVAIVANVQASANQIFLGEEVQFANFSENTTGATWFVDETIVSNTVNFLFTPEETGSYFIEVLLENSEQGCAVELEWLIEVLCPVTALFISSGDTPLPGEEVIFTNISEDAENFTWFLDGDLISTDTNIELTFENFGSFEVCLLADNGQCTTTFCQNFAIGTCDTGKENSNWITYVDGPGLNAYNFISGSPAYSTVDTPYSEGKSTISDENGNLLFSSNCQQLLNQNLEPTPNGDELMGGYSARQGALFVKIPGNELQYYLFTLDHNESGFAGGLRYNIIDRLLDDGLGDIVSGQKNIQISQPQTETMTAIRHCNYIDFWLVNYNYTEEQYESWLIDASGVAEEPVATEYPASELGPLIYFEDINVSPKGDMFLHDLSLFSFDAATGEISLITQFPFDLEISAEFAPNGKFLYIQTGELYTVLRQLNLELEIDEMLDQQYIINQPISLFYGDMALTPNGEIFCVNPFSGTLDVIHQPNLFGVALDLEADVQTNVGFVNGLGNYYHAYTGEQVFIVGPETACQGENLVYELYGCPSGDISWDISPAVPFVQELDGSVQMQFTQTGNYIISTILETGCGMMSGEFQVQIGENPYPDLGPDMNICEGTSLLLTPGEGFEEYLWSDASDGETLEIGAPGTYSVTVMEAGGCSISDEIIIGEEIVAEIDLGVDIEVCEDVILLDAGDDFADYLWQDGWTESTYTVFEPGTYWVTTTLPCFASDTIVISDCHGDGIEDLYSTLDFTLFPNPAESELSVLLTDNWSGQVVLYDQLGKLVLRRDIANETGFTISLNVLSAGVYTVTLRDDKSVGRRTLVVK